MINITLTCPKKDSHQCFPKNLHSGGNYYQVKYCIKWIAQYSYFLVVYSLKVSVNKQKGTDARKKSTRQVTSLKYYTKFLFYASSFMIGSKNMTLILFLNRNIHLLLWLVRLMYVKQKMKKYRSMCLGGGGGMCGFF